MVKLATHSTCTGCTACFSICPTKSISMVWDPEGFAYPKIDKKSCILCRHCEEVCPALHLGKTKHPLAVYAAINKDDEIRKQSSSGGFFTFLAQKVLREGGVVFGAGWSSEFSVIHKVVENEKDLENLRGSKYVQSDMGSIFSQVHEELRKNRSVLFSGTPCQVAGLRAYLKVVGKSNYELPLSGGLKDGTSQLLMVDVVCHGAPSPKVWQLYKGELEKKFGSSAIHISFRCKDYGWRRFAVAINFRNGKKYICEQSHDVYMKAFLRELISRPSCYHCLFREGRSGADITLGDYWGCAGLFKHLDDDKGLSIVLAMTHKGTKTIEAILQERSCLLEQSNYADAVRSNGSLIESPHMHLKRTVFFDRYNRVSSIIKYLKKCTRPPFYMRARALLGIIKRRFFLYNDNKIKN